MNDAQTKRAIELLDVIVRPGDHDFYREIEEAQALLGYMPKPQIRRARSFYGIHSSRSRKEHKP